MKITIVMLMAELEPAIAFWSERIGFAVTGTVPHGDKLGFAMMQNGTAEIMLQSRASAAADIAALREFHDNSRAALFIEVRDLDDVLRRLDGYPVAMPLRETFYGMKEVGVFEPGGNFVIFACPVQK